MIGEAERPPIRVLIRKPDGQRIVEFSRYADLVEAQRVAASLRAHGIDAYIDDKSALPMADPQ